MYCQVCGYDHEGTGCPTRPMGAPSGVQQVVMPCEMPCPKCGSMDIYRHYREKGDEWRADSPSSGSDKWTRAECYRVTALKPHLRHHCRCCQYDWQTLAMDRQRA